MSRNKSLVNHLANNTLVVCASGCGKYAVRNSSGKFVSGWVAKRPSFRYYPELAERDCCPACLKKHYEEKEEASEQAKKCSSESEPLRSTLSAIRRLQTP